MKYDICIVGSGAGAGPIIYELSKAGFKVLVLEKGPWLKTVDFTKDEIRKIVAGKTPVRREGRADEVADLVVYLASDKSSFVTGANFDINGGLAFS